ncbi:DUF2059 domain-containing protein [Alteromonadaceae bacterium M269]|nr:DUF2059 domain-containing protein [Alteromonadaceae bacterium M269]
MNSEKIKLVSEKQDDKGTLLAELLELLNVNLVIDQIIVGLLQKSKRSIMDNSPDANPAILKRTLSAFENEFKKEGPSLKADIAKLYADTFSIEEISQVLAFYHSAAGQRFLAGGKEIEKNLQLTASAWSKNTSNIAFKRAVELVELH